AEFRARVDSLEPGLAPVFEPEDALKAAALEQLAPDGCSVRAVVEPLGDNLRREPTATCGGQGTLDEHAVDVEVALAEIAGSEQPVAATLLEEVGLRIEMSAVRL